MRLGHVHAGHGNRLVVNAVSDLSQNRGRIAMEAMENLEAGDIVQIGTDTDDIVARCLMVVTELKSWGAQGYVQIAGKGNAYYRDKWDDMELVGRAEVVCVIYGYLRLYLRVMRQIGATNAAKEATNAGNAHPRAAQPLRARAGGCAAIVHDGRAPRTSCQCSRRPLPGAEMQRYAAAMTSPLFWAHFDILSKKLDQLSGWP